MAIGSATTSAPPRRGPEQHELIEYDRFIDRELSKTSRQMRGVDIMSGMMCWLAGALGYLMLAAAADHWLFAGGLGSLGRWLALLGLLAGSAWFLARRVLPLVLHRINPVFSAHTIERGRPQLKNSLVNFLLLRREQRDLPEAVRDALQAQAASGLAATPVEQTLDRTPLVRFALVLLGAVVVAAIYIMFSPKDPLRSAARVMLPWASIDRPTRFKLEDLQVEVVETGRKFAGGPAEVFYGQKVRISASVTNRGRVAGEPIVLRFTTADGTAENQALTLEPRERSADIILPAGTLAAAVGGGLQQSLDYTLTAGDASAGPFRITVLAAPTIEIDTLEYDYPDYTRLPNRTLQGQGDIGALEGTRVILRAKANQEIGQAWLDLGCDGRRDATMQAQGREAGVNFAIGLQEDRRTPTHSSYLLRFKNTDGFENPQPIRYQIEVTPDLAPEINWEAPREVDVPRELPVDEPIELMFSARDRDFDLAKVTLRAAIDTEKAADQRPWETSLLNQPQAGNWQSESVRFVAAEHGFRAGETIVVWGTAADNRQPQANLAETARLKVKLLPPRDPAEKQGPNHQPNDGSGSKQPQAKQPPQDQPNDPANRDRQNDERNDADREGEGGQDNSAEEPAGANGDQRHGEQAENENQQPGQQSEQGSAGAKGEQQEGQKGAGGGQQQEGGAESTEQSQSGGGEGSAGNGDKRNGQQGQGAGSAANEDQGDGDNRGAGQPGRAGQTSGQPAGGEQAANEEGAQDTPGSASEKQPSRRVDPDAQDGDAFERMKEYFDEQQNQAEKPQNSSKQPGGQAQDSSDEPLAKDNSSAGESGAASNGDKPGNTSQPEQGAAQPGAEEAPSSDAEASADQTEDATGDKRGQEAVHQEGGARNQSGADGEQQRPGEDQPQGDHQTAKPEDQAEPGNEQPSVDNQTRGGAGRQGQEQPAGTPEAQGANRQRDKGGNRSENEKPEEQQAPQSPSQSHQHSDSEGEEAGDESGGGESGGGQNADQQGTGSAGGNTEADDGSGAGQESGDGETDGRGGDDRESKHGAGEPNARPAAGEGKPGQDGRPASPPREGKGNGDKHSSGSQPQSDSQTDERGDNQSTGSAGGEGAPHGAQQSAPSQQNTPSAPNSGGHGGDNAQPPKPQPPQAEPGGDEANRDYAEKATDLVLNRLKDQLKQGEPDEALLEKLQWTKQDLERFVKRWEQMKSAAKQPGAQGQKAKSELDEALKALGLRPRGTTVKSGQSRQDQVRGNRDSRRSEPPPEYAEQYRQFNVGTSKGK